MSISSKLVCRTREALISVLALAFLLSLAGCGNKTHEGAGSTSPSGRTTTTTSATRTVILVDRTWHCRGPVDLDLVRVTMHDGRSDAIHLDHGCTGTIRRLEVPGNGADLGPGGDGVKVHGGVHDLRILSGMIDCGHKFRRKHQDAIQAMGGHRVTLTHIVSRGCANSFMFISAGLHRHEIPRDILCRDCNAVTRNYSVRVSDAIRSGATGGTFTSRLKPNAGPDAVAPVLSRNVWHPRS